MHFLGKEKGLSLLKIHSRMGPNSVMNVIYPDNQVTLSSPLLHVSMATTGIRVIHCMWSITTYIKCFGKGCSCSGRC